MNDFLKKTIRISFDGFWSTFNPYDNFIANTLSKKFNIQVVPVGNDKNIDALFYSIYALHYLDYDCPRIYYTGENSFPDFNLCDYAIGFELCFVGDRYFRYPVALADFHKDYERMEKRDISTIKNPYCRKFCAQVVSNSINTDGFRDEFFLKLNEVKSVDSGGRHLNNIGQPNGVNDKIEFLSGYKFSLCFENVSHLGYCTEKLPQSFAANTVPIYWGDPNVGKYFNEKAFINLHNFSTVNEAISEILRVDGDEELYFSMLKEPSLSGDEFSSEKIDAKFEDWLCHIFLQNESDRFRRAKFGYEKIYENNQKKLLDIIRYERKLSEYEMKKRKLLETNFITRIIRKIRSTMIE